MSYEKNDIDELYEMVANLAQQVDNLSYEVSEAHDRLRDLEDRVFVPKETNE